MTVRGGAGRAADRVMGGVAPPGARAQGRADVEERVEPVERVERVEQEWNPPPIELDYVPPEVDTTKPSIARVYDACLGGRDNYAVDRAVVEEMMRISPSAVATGRVNRAFLVRSIRHLAELGIDQFLDLGSGLPSAQNTHEVAQGVNPHARVVYVDNDPIVVAHGQALLARTDRTRVVLADLLDIDQVLTHPVVAELTDFSRPLGLVMLGIVHHVLDEEDPAGMVRAYVDRCAPGSYVCLSHVTDSFPEARELEQIFVGALGRGQMRSRETIATFFDGLELLEPGVVALPHWRPDESISGPLGHDGLMTIGGVARKP